MLKIDDLHVHYGGIHALRGIDLHVPPRSIVTLIGANGAGKSTTLRTIGGLVRPTRGRITLDGKEIVGRPADEIVKLGLAMVPEGRRVFPNLTTLDNLKLGAFSRRDRHEIERDLEWVYTLFPRLRERRGQYAGTLSGGEQQMLAVGRGLMSRPKLLMLDEPSLGLAPVLMEEIFSIVRQIREGGTTILLIEQNAYGALQLADYGYVLETGEIALEGKAQDLLQDERVKSAYLGAA
ncbi:amino acid ABC transporter ATPase [candidate division TA06 bacterium DG_24]|uniref:Branched-chain amino acid ABC transporter ATP-binding protein n=3 Tax=Bacteria division TA06 TaxID=1156500 RepID=A0A0S8JJD8_UNCT6|nr:MAG: amino acid ABC transporter ATPase [candidate division TA06 bacterium DG_24]KPK68874.1 MAG: branched-chain amino acid ABC transporter ATP-binding protein [candidate division TA06 bacterium SM23_40]KPL09784.1 MAG: branched-chain amino acid ABC transporter ATP-binding protein [candidate division TA06 bacterium SM1_40]